MTSRIQQIVFCFWLGGSCWALPSVAAPPESVPTESPTDVPLQAADDFTPEAIRQRLREGPVRLSRTFDEAVVSADPQAQDKLQARLEQLLAHKVETLAQEFSLAEQPRARLLLAGAGDLKRLVDRIRRERRALAEIDAGQADAATRQRVLEVCRELQELIRWGPFGPGSLFVKVLQRELNAEQFALAQVLSDIERQGGQVTTTIRDGRPWQQVFLPTRLHPETFDRVLRLPSLRVLRFEAAQVAAAQLADIARLTRLEVLELYVANLDEQGLRHLADLPSLRVLRVIQPPQGRAGLAALAGLHQLRELQWTGPPAGAAGLTALAELTELERLDLSGTALTDAGLVRLQLARWPRLRELGLAETGIGDDALAGIGRCAGLERLDLSGTLVTDSSLGALLNLKKLRRLLLKRTQITDDGLTLLSGSLQLERLDLSGTLVSDIGLLSLRPLLRLEFVEVAETRITDDGISEFHRALTDVTVRK